jgi:N-acetylneuraminic acid mutarotase
VAGHLPAAASDVAAGVIGATVYVVGGYTGTVPLDTIVAWSGSGTARVVARLPHPVRYAAVAAIAGRLIVAGGTSGVDATREVYSFDPADGNVRQIGLLPRPLTHAVAVALGNRVYVIGGRGTDQGTQTNTILAIDPATGRVRRAGHLPVALSDVGAATIAGAVMVAGGREPSGTLSRQVYLLRTQAR